jgi:hypothetical protein
MTAFPKMPPRFGSGEHIPFVIPRGCVPLGFLSESRLISGHHFLLKPYDQRPGDRFQLTARVSGPFHPVPKHSVQLACLGGFSEFDHKSGQSWGNEGCRNG